MDYMIIAAIIAIILMFGILGRKIGFLKIVLSIVATTISVLVSSIMTTPICEFIKSRFGLQDKIKEIVADSFENIQIEDVSYIEQLELPNIIKDKIINGIQEIEIPIKDYVVESIASVALSAIVFIVILVITSVVISVIINVADIIARLPLIRQANRGAGFVAGLVYGVVIVWIAMVVLTAMSSTEWASNTLLIIGNNEFLSFVYDTNPIMSVLTNIINKI